MEPELGWEVGWEVAVDERGPQRPSELTPSQGVGDPNYWLM